MIVSYFFKVSKLMLDYSNIVEGMSLITPVGVKGYMYFNKRVEIYEQNGDDFVRNTVTIVTTFDRYKVPRIVSVLRKFQ